mmetsp:Transcript_40958/g.78224  ORF Transcript_40958/g.78224 Transcript_40958/m.78224 type:complete len:191 (+) Transcript_40958:94-666(+)
MNLATRGFIAVLYTSVVVIGAADMIKVGDTLPAVKVFEGEPENAVDVRALLQVKKAVLFGVPGAFTPGCSATHLPSYLNNHRHLKAAGVSLVACVSVNDPFVMAAWGESQGVEGKIRMLADTNAELTKAMGLDVAVDALGGIRSKRYSMVIENGVVTSINVEPDGFGLTCSLAPNLFDVLDYRGHIRDEL